MCRLALMNKDGARWIEKEIGLAEYLGYLEQRLGGHGNGYALVKGGKCIKLIKGTHLKTSSIARDALKSDYDWLVFHTRLASCGSRTDMNCHPFIKARTGDLLAANGTEWELTWYNHKTGRDMTDTQSVLMYYVTDDDFMADLKTLTAVYIGLHDRKMFAIRNRGQLEIIKRGRATVLASEFPWPIKAMAKPCREWHES